MTWDQTGQYEVSELRGDGGGLDVTGDWMTTLLQTKAFHRIPPANIQAIFMRMQRINYRARRHRHQTGHRGRLFLRRGRGQMRRDARDAAQQGRHQARRTGPGDSFGEEALIAEAKRNATVTMSTDGTLMRLGKNDFQTLLNEPCCSGWITTAQGNRRRAASGWTCACPANSRIFASTARSIFRCISSG
jgi:CRP-like cAMP-binding protein